MDLRDTYYEGVDWIYLAEDRVQWRSLLDTVMNSRDQCKAGNLTS